MTVSRMTVSRMTVSRMTVSVTKIQFNGLGQDNQHNILNVTFNLNLTFNINDKHHNGTQRNDTHHNRLNCHIQHNDTHHDDTEHNDTRLNIIHQQDYYATCCQAKFKHTERPSVVIKAEVVICLKITISSFFYFGEFHSGFRPVGRGKEFRLACSSACRTCIPELTATNLNFCPALTNVTQHSCQNFQ